MFDQDPPADDDATPSTKQECLFFKLPGELRNEIYELAFGSDRQFCLCASKCSKTYCICNNQCGPRHSNICSARQNYPGPPPWISTCKQIYGEARPMWYSQLQVYFSRKSALTKWLESMTPRRTRMLRFVCFDSPRAAKWDWEDMGEVFFDLRREREDLGLEMEMSALKLPLAQRLRGNEEDRFVDETDERVVKVEWGSQFAFSAK